MQPGEAGKANQTVIEPLQDGPYYITRNGTFTVKNSLLVQKGTTYHAYVLAEGVNALRPNLCSDALIPASNFSWTITDNGKLVVVPEFPISSFSIFLLVGMVVGAVVLVQRFGSHSHNAIR
jgi:hypothetical protein